MTNKPEKLGEYKVHPVAALFPLFDETRLDELAADIKQNGLRDPITLSADGKTLIDGRNRFLGCKRAKVEAEFELLPPGYSEADIIKFIISKNLRRDLTAGQRAMIGLQIAPALEAAAKERQREGGKTAGRGHPKKVPGNSRKQKDRSGEVREQIAAMGRR